MEPYSEVLKFWFEETSTSQKWQKDPRFDKLIRERFEATYKCAMKGELYFWRKSAEGRLAEIIVLDQFSRNMYRDTKEAFSGDGLALTLSQEAVLNGHHQTLDESKRAFLLMPYMHSESKIIHIEAERLFKEYAPANYDYEVKHKAIIDRFSRYPHRNKILGRESTSEELEFLKGPGSSF